MTTSPLPPPWRTSVDDIVAETAKRASQISLGQQSRVAIDLPGFDTPLLLDRWEFEAFGRKSKDAAAFTRAAALRLQCHELAGILEAREKLQPMDLQSILDAVPPLVKASDEQASQLTRLGDSGDPAQQRKFHLTRDNLVKEIDHLAEIFVNGGGRLQRAAARAGAKAVVKAETARETLEQEALASVSGAFTRSTPAVEVPLWKKVLVPILFLVAVAITVYNLLPEPDRRVPLKVEEMQKLAPVAAAYMLDGSVSATVTNQWVTFTRSERQEKARALYEYVKKEHQATRLRLYKPDNRLLAAMVTDQGIRLFD